MPVTGQEQEVETSGAMRTYLLALTIGVGVGVLGAAFHYCLDAASTLHLKMASLSAGDGPGAIIVAALVGAAMVGLAFVLVRRFAPEAAGSGIQEIEGAMAGLRPVRWRRVLPVKFVGGVLAMGSGLVLGREGPTIHLGGSIGKLIGEKLGADTDTMNTLLAAGAAAGLSVAFSAPLGAILFVTEEMRRRFNYTFISLHSVIIASISAKLINDQVFGMQPQLPLQLQTWLPNLPSVDSLLVILPLFVVLGGVIGIFATGFNTAMLGCLHIADRLSGRTMLIIASTVGAIAGALMVVVPEFVGGGESLVKELFSTSPALGLLAALLVVRTVMTFLSYSVGVPGGIFAPMLALGTLIGLGFGTLAQDLFQTVDMHTGAFGIAAMGALFAATVRAPLTGIVLVAEMTASFNLLPALIVTCMTASITAQSLGSTPIYDLLLTRTLDNARKKA